MSTSLETLVIVTAVACGLVGGSFFVISAFIMRALADLAPEAGTRAMQALNVRAVTPVFMTALFGTAPLCLVTGGWAAAAADGAARVLVILGVLGYLLGCVLVTIAGNVPLNNRLAAVTAGTPEADDVWARYQKAWTRWNTVRAIAATAASALLIVAVAHG
ncbi:anthrone oxygenase family protein [Spirillospora sp. NPDC029432]|uniref:anthrone oxygenase family protein n=1 Tax=Spirillospora sp. NPDC029432 TaxID=3154599 RepID=UPI0034519877